MKNITVSVDEETHRLVRIRAAEWRRPCRLWYETISRDWHAGGSPWLGMDVEAPRERRRRLMNEVFEEIRATRSGFSSSENLSRQTLYERRAVR